MYVCMCIISQKRKDRITLAPFFRHLPKSRMLRLQTGNADHVTAGHLRQRLTNRSGFREGKFVNTSSVSVSEKAIVVENAVSLD